MAHLLDQMESWNFMPATVETPPHCGNTGSSEGCLMPPAGFACASHWLSHSVFVLAGAAREHTSMADFLQHIPQGGAFWCCLWTWLLAGAASMAEQAGRSISAQTASAGHQNAAIAGRGGCCLGRFH